jgi:hypothetical protein
VTGVRLPTRVGYPMPVVVGALATPKVPLFVVRHRSGFSRGRVRADAAGPDDGSGRRRAGTDDQQVGCTVSRYTHDAKVSRKLSTTGLFIDGLSRCFLP